MGNRCTCCFQSQWETRQDEAQTLAKSRQLAERKFAAGRRLKEHVIALKEIRAGKKKGHWIWWVYPPLRSYGRDEFTPDEACLDGLEDAKAYLGHAQLRKNLLDVLHASKGAMSKKKERAPWHVFDSHFGRDARGAFIQGPVDAFKVRACATLFVAAAHELQDEKVHKACLGVLAFFTGDCAYTDKGSGSIPDQEGRWTNELEYLTGPDLAVLELINVNASVCEPLTPSQ